MNDFFEMLKFCAFDVDAASEMAKTQCPQEVIEEAMKDIGLERMEPKPQCSPRW